MASYEEIAVVERYRLTASTNGATAIVEHLLPQLHEDVLSIIFSHLPLTSLGPCVRVSRRWRKLIGNEYGRRAASFHRKGQYRKAESYYTRSILLNPVNPYFYEDRALSRLHLKQKQGAVEDFIRCSELLKDPDYKKIIEAVVLSEKGNDTGAVKLIDEVLNGERCKEGRITTWALSNAYFERGYSVMTYNVKEAIADFTLALHYKFPRDYAVYNNRAWCHENQGDYQEAIADYKESMRANPYYTMAVSNLSACLRDPRIPDVEADKLYAEWLTNLDREIAKVGDPLLVEHPEDIAHLWVHRGQILRAQELFEEAIKSFTLSLRLKYDCDFIVLHWRGVCYEQLGELDAAMENYNLSLQSNEYFADPLSARAHIHVFQKKLDLALADMDLFKKRHPHDPWPYRYVAAIFADMGEFVQGIKELKAALQVAPDDVDTIELLGSFYSHEQMFVEALELYARCIVPQLRKPRALLYRANIYLAQGNYEAALKDYEECLKHKGPYPFSDEALNNLGVLHCLLNDFDSAIQRFDEYLKSLEEQGVLDHVALLNRAWAHLAAGHFALASVDLNNAISLPAPYTDAQLRRIRGALADLASAQRALTYKVFSFKFDVHFQPFLSQVLNSVPHAIKTRSGSESESGE